ncbi:hypothetical protein [Catenulispora pinisilvae]|uniref:hypothetical protein n=1 Tax=Catenulispora pinisilvae TaxID=2705253 RepID=UPI0018926CF0|nr:hypothetical protein [Catenulispora pinisilvae]
MPTDVQFIGPANRHAITLRPGSNLPSAKGGPLPRISLFVEARLKDAQFKTEIIQLSFDAYLGDVLVGQGAVGPVTYLTTDGQQVEAAFTCPRSALPLFLDPPPGRVELKLRFSGLLRYQHEFTGARAEGLEAAGVWHQWPISNNLVHELTVSIARSDWYELVVAPLKLGGYLIASLNLPDPTEVPAWTAALDHLESARRALTTGDAPAVFGYCRAAIDALPGAKKNIFDNMAVGKKREAIDALTLSLGTYLHSGRHVEPTTGATGGDFPVDRQDAALAYNETVLLLSHIASLVLP